MVENLNEKYSKEDVDDAFAFIFKDMLGFISGYAKGMWYSVIPKPSPSMYKNNAFLRLASENKMNKTCADIYRTQLESLMGDISFVRKDFLGKRNN